MTTLLSHGPPALTITAGFSTRPDGNVSLSLGDDPAAVHRTRAAILASAGLGGLPVATVRQVHGAHCVTVDPSYLQREPYEADGMVTAAPRIVLMIGVADCVPIVLTDPFAGCVGVLHAGWRGLHAGIVEAGIGALAALGGDPGRIQAWLGPSICPNCYPVGQHTRALVTRRYPQAAAMTPAGDGSLDLIAASMEALRNAGVHKSDIVEECTLENPARWFSRRRDGRSGVQAALVAISR
jgi:YfiH family protein